MQLRYVTVSANVVGHLWCGGLGKLQVERTFTPDPTNVGGEVYLWRGARAAVEEILESQTGRDFDGPVSLERPHIGVEAGFQRGKVNVTMNTVVRKGQWLDGIPVYLS